MGAANLIPPRLRHYAVHWVLLTAMLVGSFVPSGYMLDRSDETQGIVIRICSAHTPDRYVLWDPTTGQTRPTDPDAPDTPEQDEDQDIDDTGLCAFSFTAVAGTLMAGGTVGQPIHAASGQRPLARAPPAKRHTQSALPARGPPLAA